METADATGPAGRGPLVSRRAVLQAGAALGVEETVRPEPVTLAELRKTDPKLLYWFERRSLAS